MLWGLVMSLIYMRENIPLKQNKSLRRIFSPMLQKKRNISLTQDKVSKPGYIQAAIQDFLNLFQPNDAII